MPGSDHPLRVGLKLSQDVSIDAFRRVWRIADEAGFDHCWAFDHLATKGPSDADRLVFEGWSLLAAMAEATSRIRIGLLVTGMTYRHPALLAKQAVTVDHLSGGRLEFGIGASWPDVESAMFDLGGGGHRVGRLSEGLQVLTMLWTQPRSSFEGRYYRLRDAAANPKPVQRPHPPIWIGAEGPEMLRIAARHADVWNPAGDGLDAALRAGRRLSAACRRIDRGPGEIRWSAQLLFDGEDPSAMAGELSRWHEAGFTELVIYCVGPDPLRAAEVAAESILPRARA